MLSALYFPHTEIADVALMKTSLLLWDEVIVIAPFPGYEPRYDRNDPIGRAFGTIGRCHPPTEDERTKAHDLIIDFATSQRDERFQYASLKNPEDVYELYPQKLLMQTWSDLKTLGFVGTDWRAGDPPATSFTGLTLMNILADCCAGEALARITDEQDAYTQLAGLFVEPKMAIESAAREKATREWLIQRSLKVLNLDDVPIDRLIAFRERERNGSSERDYAKLRHNYNQRIEESVKKMANVTTGAALNTLQAEFEAAMRDDVKTLRDELKATWTDNLFSKEIAFPVVTAGVTAATYFSGLPLPTSEMFTALGAPVAAAGLFKTGSKIARERRKTFAAHPMSYLYQVKHR